MKRLAVRRISRIMNVGENHMAWFYEIRDSNKVVAETGRGFATQSAAMAAACVATAAVGKSNDCLLGSIIIVASSFAGNTTQRISSGWFSLRAL